MSKLSEKYRAEGFIGADLNVSEILRGQLEKTPVVHIETEVRDFVFVDLVTGRGVLKMEKN